jgi:hypothetical protein
MHTKTLFPLTAATLFALSLSAASLSSDRQQERAVATAASEIVDLHSITVRPAAEDAAYYRANRIVDLAAVSVRPDPQDLAYFVASSQVRIVDFPVVTVRPRAEMEVASAGMRTVSQQVATR